MVAADQFLMDRYCAADAYFSVREVRLDIDGFPEIRALRDEVARLRAEARVEAPWLGRRGCRAIASSKSSSI